MQLKKSWKSKLLAATLTAATFTAVTIPAVSQIGIVIGHNPPPIRYERRPPMPGQGYVWIAGYWGARDGRYVWVPGRWDRPPYAGAYWSHPHYDHYSDGWHVHDGHWDREDHEDHYYDHHDDHGHH